MTKHFLTTVTLKKLQNRVRISTTKIFGSPREIPHQVLGKYDINDVKLRTPPPLHPLCKFSLIKNRARCHTHVRSTGVGVPHHRSHTSLKNRTARQTTLQTRGSLINIPGAILLITHERGAKQHAKGKDLLYMYVYLFLYRRSKQMLTPIYSIRQSDAPSYDRTFM